VLLPLGAIAALAANVLRLTGLMVLGAAGHEDLAMGGFHSKAGWILFLGIALLTVALAERARWLRAPGAASPAAAPGDLPPDAAAHVAPLVAALAAALLTGAFSAGALDRGYALRIAAAVAVLVAVRRVLPRLAPAAPPLAVAAGAAVAAVWVLVPGGDGAALQAGLRALGPAERAAWIAVRLAGSVLVVPVVEELAFRGFLLPWLAARADGAPRRLPWAAVLVSSAAFGALHANIPLGALAGVAFALVRLRTGRLADAVVAHAVANAGVALAVLAFGRWDLWA
jgi:exosortase E/protease (VPEID-CTERM system)